MHVIVSVPFNAYPSSQLNVHVSVNEVPVQVTFPFPGAGLAGQVTAVTNIYSAGYINLIVKHFYKAQKSVRNC